MNIKILFLLFILIEAILFNIKIKSNAAFGQVTAKYNQFKDKTTLSLIGEQNKERPILRVWSQFEGQRPDTSDILEAGFLVKKECLPPNFIANGKRIVPDEDNENPHYSSSLERNSNLNSNEEYMFTYNFYNLSQLKQIASARSVRCEVCGKTYELSSQDKLYLRQFISHYKFK